MVTIKQQLIKDTPYKYGVLNGKKYIAIHETDNVKKGAGAQNHATLQSNGNSRDASWHWQVDDKEAIQSFDHKFQLWHGGDGRHDGNLNSIGIEICVNADGDYLKAVQNAIELAKHICDMEGIPVDRVKQHHAFSGKNCPRYLRSGVKGFNWGQFTAQLLTPKTSPNVKPVVPVKPVFQKPVANQNTNSIVDYLVSIKQDASFANRAKLAVKYGVNGYQGTAKQNTELLTLMRGGTSKPVAKKYTKALGENSLVDFLKANGVDSSFTHRKTLAGELGISSYRGLVKQNIALLGKLKQL